MTPEQSTLESAPVVPKPEHSESLVDDHQHDEELFPKADMTTKVAMFTAVVFPFLGLIIAISLAWQNGYVDGLYLGMVVFGWVFTSLGITIGFHRLMSHKAFETYRWVRAAWMIIGTMSIEGAPLVWCAVHRRHHSFSDQHGDPHSPHLHGGGFLGKIRGFWHGQVGWLFTGYWTKPNMEKYIPDLLKDPLLVFLNKWYGIFVLLSLIIPTAVGYLYEGTMWGAFLGFLWGGLVRVFVAHHVTWSINSVCHIWGQRDYKSNDHSTNNAICGILACGEGWHNNHHAFPSSARHGLKWWQFDLSWIVIRAMQMCGLVWDIKLPSKHALQSKSLKS